MAKTYFVTGTDTDAGKTLVSTALLSVARTQGLSTAAVKPVAAGCETTEQGLRNSDARLLHAQCSIKLSYEQVNPLALAPAIAPHIAAAEAGRVINVDRLAGMCRGVMMERANLTLIEGAGGWRVPVNPSQTLADLAKTLNVPVLLVVGMKLGCINHALLSCEAILRDGLKLAGWVANCMDPTMAVLEQNIQSLQARIPAPLLGVVPHLDKATPEAAAAHLSLKDLL